MTPHDDPAMQMNYLVWDIVERAKSDLLILGFNLIEGERRGRTASRHPAEGLRLIAIDAENINDLIVSHLHYEQIGIYDEFSRQNIIYKNQSSCIRGNVK